MLNARFDWYQATFDGGDAASVARTLGLVVGASTESTRALFGYSTGVAVVHDDHMLASAYSGCARPGEVHVQVTGSACDQLVPVLRRIWPAHRVSRADAAVDFEAEFAALDRVAVEFAEDRRLRFRLVTDSEGGATRYLGSPRSEVMARVYKKSEQLRAQHPDQAAEIPDGIVRAEVQVRPGKRETKEAAAITDAEDFWGFSEWSAQFAVRVLDLMPLRTVSHFRRSSDWARSVHWLGRQYGPLVAKRSAEVGTDAAISDVLDALVKLDAEDDA